MSFLASLLLPVIAAALYLRGYVERASVGKAPAQLPTAGALRGGALSGAAALVFLGVMGVVILAYRGRPMTPAGLEVGGAVFWLVQFALAAAIGATLGALTAAAMLPWARGRLARLVPPA